MKHPKIPRSNKDSRAAADAAYLRSQQIDLLTESIPSVSNAPEPMMISTIPIICPSCAKTMQLESGWTALAATTAGVGIIQCGGCGHSISVPLDVFETYRGQLKALADARAASIAARQQKPKRDTAGRRTRGAG